MSANVSSLLYIRQHDHCPGCRWRTPYNCWPQSLGNPHGHSIHTLEEKTKDQNCRASISSTVFTELSILWSGRNCFLLPLIKSSQTVLTQRIMQKNPNVGDKSQTYVHIWWLHCPPAACDIHHRTCVWRWRVSRNNEPLDSWSELWQCWSRQTPLISDIAHGPQSCKLCRKKGES